MLTPDCYESHVPRWDCEGVGEGVTHLPADIKINYYWIKNAWLLHTMCTGRSCHYAGTRSSAQHSQKKPENKQYSILPSKGKAYREGITYGVNNHRGEMPEMLWNVVTKKKKLIPVHILVIAGKSILPGTTVNYLFAWKHKIKEQFPDCMEMFFSHGHVLRERNWTQSDTVMVTQQWAPCPREKAWRSGNKHTLGKKNS